MIQKKNTDYFNTVFVNNYGKRELCLTKGEGSYVWDNQDNKYLDFTSGIAVNVLGHNNELVVKAVQEQLGNITHSSNLFLNVSSSQLAMNLNNLTNFKVFFSNSGTEANEAAIKFVRKYGYTEGLNRSEIISFTNSFHGRTFGSLSATGQSNMQKPFGNMLQGFKQIPINDCDALRNVVTDKTLAIIVEPILAEGGVISLTREFINTINEIQSMGIFVICDEVQTGIGRLGTLFGYEKVGLKPDVITLAKALGGGLPLGATLVNSTIDGVIEQGDHGSTFGGNCLSCAAGLAVLQKVSKISFLELVNKKSKYFRDLLEKWLQIYSGLGFEPRVRGEGLLMGVVSKSSVSKNVFMLQKAGVLVLKSGSNVIRILPPLNVSYDEIDFFMKRWRQIIE